MSIESNIEEKFFEAFDIKPTKLSYPDNFECYPEITDRILLELICLLSYKTIYDYIRLSVRNVKELKNYVLSELTSIMTGKYVHHKTKDKTKRLVNKIFKEFSDTLA